MNRLSISIPHQLGTAEAKRRIDEGTDQLRRQSGGLLGPVETRWQGDTLTFQALPMGQSISGEVFVAEQVVRIEVVLPWLLAALAGTVRQSIETQGRVLLENRSRPVEKKST